MGHFTKSAVICLALTACATPPDVPICVDLDTQGYCIWTISNHEQYVDETNLLLGEPWSKVKSTSLLVPSKSWAQIKEFILKVCKQHKDCRDNIGLWSSSAESIDKSLQNK